MLSHTKKLIIFLLVGAVCFSSCSHSTSGETSGNSTNKGNETSSSSSSTDTSSTQANQPQENQPAAEETGPSFTFTVDFPSSVSLTDLISYDETKHAFVAKDGYEAYEWWLNGETLSIDKGFVVLTDEIINNYSLQTGKCYSMMVIITDFNGEQYSSTLEFKLTASN